MWNRIRSSTSRRRTREHKQCLRIVASMSGASISGARSSSMKHSPSRAGRAVRVATIQNTYSGNHGSRIGTALGNRPKHFARRNTPSLLYLDDGFQLSPKDKQVYETLPPPLAGGPTQPLFTSLEDAKKAETALPDDAYSERKRAAARSVSADARDPVRRLHGRPGASVLSDVATAGLQRRACDTRQSLRLYERSLRLGRADCQHRQQRQPAPTPLVDREGARALGFYNVQAGDAPYFKYIADTYAMSDNFHQAIQGGTEANHVALGTGDRSGLATARVARSCRPSSTRKIPIRSRAQTTITRKTVTPAGRTA